ncbi:MAG: S8/S53 family peptidase [Bacteroidota bacterium]
MGQNQVQRPYFTMPSQSDSNQFEEDKVIFKMKSSWGEYCKANEISLDRFKNFQKTLGVHSVQKMFPRHAPPLKQKHSSGQDYADLSNIYTMQVPDSVSLERAINDLYATGLVEYAQLYVVPENLYVPDDPFADSQYYLENIQAYEAWDIQQGDTSIVIAITDTGIDLLHPDLVGSIAYNYDDPINGEDSDNDGYVDNFHGWDTGENDNDPQYDENAHGVHVSGAAAATPDIGTGIAGVGFSSRLLPVKISDADGRLVGSYQGIVYAADQGADVINCSWGSTLSPGQFGQDIINYAVLNRNAVVVCATGNSDNELKLYPASYKNSLSVAATDVNDVKWSGSSYGSSVDLSAPGANVYSTWPNGSYIPGNGTSFAAPQVAGAAALLKAQFPDYNALQIMAQLKVTTDNIDTIPDNQPYTGLMGTGRLNVYKALSDTTKPYLLLTQLEHSEDYYQQFNPGESFELGAEFLNLLAPSQNLNAVLSSKSDFVDIVSQNSFLGEFDHLQSSNNFSDPFMIAISDSMPPSQEVEFTISFYTHEGQFAGRQNFSITFNLDYVDLITERISTTVNSKGNLGYNYPDFNQGLGFIVENANQNRSMLSCAGFVAGNSASAVVDNIYGAMEDSFSNLFVPSENARMKEDTGLGDSRVAGSFNDSLAESKRLGIHVDYNVFSFDSEYLSNFLILEYKVVNGSEDNIPGFYAGFFADWQLQDVKNHRAAFHQELNMGYAFSATGGDFTALQLINHDNINHYAFDNQGYGGSLRIDNGFTSFEKYTAMKSSRDNAGFFDVDNDISTLISAGPFNFLKGDTLTFAFALIAGANINEIENSAINARQIYNGEFLNDQIRTASDTKIRVFPNPAVDKVIHISMGDQIHNPLKIQIFDMNGKLHHHQYLNTYQTEESLFSLRLDGLPSGFYILKIESEKGVVNKKINVL